MAMGARLDPGVSDKGFESVRVPAAGAEPHNLALTQRGRLEDDGRRSGCAVEARPSTTGPRQVELSSRRG